MSTDDVFDVAVDRKRKRESEITTWSKKRATHGKELTKQINAVNAEQDPQKALALLTGLETMITKHKETIVLSGANQLDAAATKTFGTTRRYTIIHADPPWKYKKSEHENSAEKHYDVMSDEELSALPVGGLTDDSAVCVMWATFHKIQAAVSIMESWGFTYQTIFMVWEKVDRLGSPMYGKASWTLPNCEFALIGQKGTIRIGERQVKNMPSIIRWRPRDHSQKPPAVLDAIVRLIGDYPRIDLFGRCDDNTDWDVWGNQTTLFANQLVFEPAEPNEAEQLAKRFLPIKDETLKNSRERVRQADRAGLCNFYGRAGASISFGKRDHYEIKSGSVGVDDDGEDDAATREAWSKVDHDHDGTRPCCAPLWNLLNGTQVLRNMTTINAYLTRRGGYNAVRHPLYQQHSLATVRRHKALIRRRQDHAADVLYAINNNTGKAARTRVRVRAIDVPVSTQKKK